MFHSESCLKSHHVCRAPSAPKTTQIVFPPTEAAAAAPARSAGAAMLLRLFLHLSDEHVKGCSHSCQEGRVGPASHPPSAGNSSHHCHKRHDFPAEQLIPTASGFAVDQGNFKFSLFFPVSSVLCLSPLLRQTMAEVSAQNLGVGWRSGKGDFPFSEHYHSPWGLFCHCRAQRPSPHLAAHQGRNKACPCFKSKHGGLFLLK